MVRTIIGVFQNEVQDHEGIGISVWFNITVKVSFKDKLKMMANIVRTFRVRTKVRIRTRFRATFKFKFMVILSSGS